MGRVRNISNSETLYAKNFHCFLSCLTVYSVFPDTLRIPRRFDSGHPLKEHGKNWVSILRELMKEGDTKEDIVTGLRKVTGDIEDVRVVSAAGYLIAEFK